MDGVMIVGVVGWVESRLVGVVDGKWLWVWSGGWWGVPLNRHLVSV